MKTLIITFGRKSNDNQAVTLGTKLSGNDKCYVKKVLFNSLIKLPNFITYFVPAWMMIKKADDFFDIEDCDVIISCGRRTLKYCKHLKKNNFPNAKLIQIMNPDIYDKSIDLLLLPEHDKRLVFDYKNILYYRGSLFKAYNPVEVETSMSHFKNTIEKLQMPLISFIVGGSSSNFHYTKKIAEKMVSEVVKVAEKMGAALLVVTSRRTDNFIIEMLREKVKNPSLLFVFDHRNDFNPFLCFMHMSNFNVVTGDSISIISEALSLKKPLYIYKIPHEVNKYEHFYASATEYGKARFFDNTVNALEAFETSDLNDLDELVLKIKNNLSLS